MKFTHAYPINVRTSNLFIEPLTKILVKSFLRFQVQLYLLCLVYDHYGTLTYFGIQFRILVSFGKFEVSASSDGLEFWPHLEKFKF